MNEQKLRILRRQLCKLAGELGFKMRTPHLGPNERRHLVRDVTKRPLNDIADPQSQIEYETCRMARVEYEELSDVDSQEITDEINLRLVKALGGKIK